ncbi:MAG: hypothetical protein QOI90_3532 [Mycobacterium sp.]|nr:hypothetical protein [Mycobacterium sp.]
MPEFGRSERHPHQPLAGNAPASVPPARDDDPDGGDGDQCHRQYRAGPGLGGEYLRSLHGKVFPVGGLLLNAARDLVQRGHNGFAGRTVSGVGRGLRILDTCVLSRKVGDPKVVSGCVLVLGSVGEWFESHVVSEGLELFDGFGFGLAWMVSGVVIGARVAVEGAVEQHVVGVGQHLVRNGDLGDLAGWCAALVLGLALL